MEITKEQAATLVKDLGAVPIKDIYGQSYILYEGNIFLISEIPREVLNAYSAAESSNSS